MARFSHVSNEQILEANKKAVADGKSRAWLAEHLGLLEGTLISRLNSIRGGIRQNILAVRPDISPELLERAVESQCPTSNTRVHARPSSKKRLISSLATEALAMLDRETLDDQTEQGEQTQES